MKKLIIILTVTALLTGLTLGLQAQTRGSREVTETRKQSEVKEEKSRSVQVEKEEVAQPARTAASRSGSVRSDKSDEERASRPAVRQTLKQERSRTSEPTANKTQSSSRSSSSSSSFSRNDSPYETTSSRTSKSNTDSGNSYPSDTERTTNRSDSRTTQHSRQNSFDDDYYNYTSPVTRQPAQTRTTKPDKTTLKNENENTRSNPSRDKEVAEKEKPTSSQIQKVKMETETVYKSFTPDGKVKEQASISNIGKTSDQKGNQAPDGKKVIRDNSQFSPSDQNQPFELGRGIRPPQSGDDDNDYYDGPDNHGGGHGGNNHGGGHGDHNNDHGWTGYHNNHGWNWRPPRNWHWHNHYNNWYWQNPYHHVTWYNHPWDWYNPHFSWNWYFAFHNFGYVSYVHYYDWYPSHHWIVYPSFSHYYSWTNRIQEFTGYLIIDELDTIYPYSYGLVTRKLNGDYATFYFDRYGNRLARRLIDRYGHLNKKIYVEVRGYVDYSDQTIRVTSMRKVNWHRNMYLSFYYHPRWFRLGFWHWG